MARLARSPAAPAKRSPSREPSTGSWVLSRDHSRTWLQARRRHLYWMRQRRTRTQPTAWGCSGSDSQRGFVASAGAATGAVASAGAATGAAASAGAATGAAESAGAATGAAASAGAATGAAACAGGGTGAAASAGAATGAAASAGAATGAAATAATDAGAGSGVGAAGESSRRGDRALPGDDHAGASERCRGLAAGNRPSSERSSSAPKTTVNSRTYRGAGVPSWARRWYVRARSSSSRWRNPSGSTSTIWAFGPSW